MREISRLEAAPQPLRIIDAETATAEQMMLRTVPRVERSGTTDGDSATQV